MAQTHQLMCIGSNKRQVVRGDIQHYTIHDWPQFIISRSEQGRIDAPEQGRCGEFQLTLVFIEFLESGKFIAILGNEFIPAILVGDGHLQAVFVDFKPQGLFGQLAQGIQQGLG